MAYLEKLFKKRKSAKSFYSKGVRKFGKRSMSMRKKGKKYKVCVKV